MNGVVTPREIRLDPPAARRRRWALRLWRLFNPLARPLAGWAPWWVVLETTGRRSGRPRQTPLASGPVDDGVMWLICVHGRHAAWAQNIVAEPRVRLRRRGRWQRGVASIEPMDPEILARFNAYARAGPTTLGIDPVLVRVDLASR